jgi:tryptophanyl-tRNA synthetase
MLEEQRPWRERAQPFADRPELLREIVADGCQRARTIAQQTMRDVREAMGLEYR